ncbi:hypothetical protein E4631_08580 [Hymenobacter sp. UV11]|uniref:hypothetical protein n=1 Tax=Hymenobacter sp. UV11 TaxID=1849735 RepID=UPI00105C3086|nr:hypothetical protein [Hymenobacter sp. UV11]TDN36292.1 hypothetical protein A8B98_10285 [Hymenobacter sp. UV11]TFZ67001.1 hypothetical protein E4631_08580 [Hymenobacter sp. UV11]
MKQDIPFDSVEGITIAIVPDEDIAPGTDGVPTWTVYLLNHNDLSLETVLISSEGYGTQPTGEAVRTTTLRYHFPEVGPHSATPVELIDPAVFHLTNQYWVSYYRDSKIFDKKFVFVPDSIVVANLSRLDLLAGRMGVLHS